MNSEAEVDVKAQICPSHSLNDKWVLYHHLPSDKDWTLNGYTILSNSIDTVEHAIGINNALTENMIKFSMLFLMRENVSPLWEDENNKNGGCFSYKVINKHVVQVWRDIMYLTTGDSLGLNRDYTNTINGITISPKKNFCIVKIWLRDSNHQDPQMIASVDNLTRHGVIFKKHGET